MIRKLLFIFFVLTTPAYAQLAGSCQMYDTTSLSVNASAVISDCTANTGKYGNIYVSVTGELSCIANNSNLTGIQLFAMSSITHKPLGARVTASITGGVMTVTSMLTPWPSNFAIEPGSTTFLFDSQNGAGIPKGSTGSTLTVVNQLTNTDITGLAGGTGTYTVSDATVTVASETIWVLYNSLSTGGGAGTVAIGRDTLEHSMCRNGNTYIVTRTGFPSTLGTNAIVRFILVLLSETTGGNPGTSIWNNGLISWATPGTFGGGIVQ